MRWRMQKTKSTNNLQTGDCNKVIALIVLVDRINGRVWKRRKYNACHMFTICCPYLSLYECMRVLDVLVIWNDNHLYSVWSEWNLLLHTRSWVYCHLSAQLYRLCITHTIAAPSEIGIIRGLMSNVIWHWISAANKYSLLWWWYMRARKACATRCTYCLPPTRYKLTNKRTVEFDWPIIVLLIQEQRHQKSHDIRF